MGSGMSLWFPGRCGHGDMVSQEMTLFCAGRQRVVLVAAVDAGARWLEWRMAGMCVRRKPVQLMDVVEGGEEVRIVFGDPMRCDVWSLRVLTRTHFLLHDVRSNRLRVLPRQVAVPDAVETAFLPLEWAVLCAVVRQA